MLWHLKLGHPGVARLRTACVGVPGADVASWPAELPTCEDCLTGKMTKAPVNRSTHRTEADSRLGKGERLDVDTIGPMVRSHGGNLFGVEATDRATRMTFTRSVTQKSKAAEALVDILDTDVAQYGTRVVSEIRTDLGGEYTAGECKQMCAERGIRLTYAATATPSHNGLAERNHRTIQDTVRCMLQTAGLGQEFWAEAYKYATHLKNVLPTSALGGKSPYEMWTGDPPRLHDLHTFGSRVKYLAPRSGDWGKKAAEGLYLGPSFNTTGGASRVFNLETKRVVITRDTMILEDTSKLPPSPLPPVRAAAPVEPRVSAGDDS